MNIVFRGVMLFCTQGKDKDAVLTEVLLPDCEDRIPPHGTQHGNQIYHLDGTRAVPHYAGILVAPKKDRPKYYDLRGVDVTIGVETADQPKIGEKINGFTKTADIKENGNHLEVDWQAPRASRITLGAGPSNDDFKPKGPSYKFKLGKQEQMHNSLTVTYSDDVVVKLSIDQGTIPVPKDATLYIYNFDERRPTVKQLEGENETTKPFIIDHDFKWIYSVLKPESGENLDKWAAGYLPAPIWVRPSSDEYFTATGTRAITVSTCFPGWI